MDGLARRPDWHRFMVVMAAGQGFRLAERPAPLYPRRAGKSKFGIARIPVGVLDLVSVWFQLRFGRKPMLFFGVAGALLFPLGFLVGVGPPSLRLRPPPPRVRPPPALLTGSATSGTPLFSLCFPRAHPAP